MLQGIIFDLDGVIADTVPAHFIAWKRLFNEEGYAFDEAIYHEKVDGRRRFDGAQAVMTDADAQYVEIAAKRKDKYFMELIEQGKFKIFDDTLDFINLCISEGIRLATASSSRNAHYILKKAGIADSFTSIVGGDDVERGKPDPSIFLIAARQLGLETRCCLVIEDAISGVIAAKAGGFYCIGLDRKNQQARLVGADRIVRSLADLEISDLRSCLGTY